MAEILLFHHAHGQTEGFLGFVAELRSAGHNVHAPDLYDGRTFDDLRKGVDYAEQVGFREIIARGAAAAVSLPPTIVYAGFSLRALPAQALAQTRPGARGALLFHGGVPTSEFGQPWPAGVPLQMHAMEGDEWTEIDVVQPLAKQAEEGEVFLYPGAGHLFADRSSSDYEPESAALLMQRTLAFLARSG